MESVVFFSIRHGDANRLVFRADSRSADLGDLGSRDGKDWRSLLDTESVVTP